MANKLLTFDDFEETDINNDAVNKKDLLTFDDFEEKEVTSELETRKTFTRKREEIPQRKIAGDPRFRMGEVLASPETIKTASDLLLPTIGGALGARFGGVRGAKVGAALGATVAEGVEQVVTPEERRKPLFPETPKQLITGNSVTDLATEIVFQQIPIEKVARAGLEKASKLFKQKSAAAKTFKQTGDALKNYFDDVFKKVPKNKLPIVTRDLALEYERIGIPTVGTERLLDRGVLNVFKPKHMTRQAISQDTINKVSQVIPKSFSRLNKEFQNRMIPLLKKSKKTVDIDDVSKILDDATSELFKIRNGKRVPVAAIDRPIARTLDNLQDELLDLGAKPSALKLHEFKQNVNKVLKKKVILDNPTASKALFRVNSQLRDKIDEVAPGYKDLTDEFRGVFELEEQVGKRLSKDKAESLLKDYYNPEKENLRTVFNKIIDLDDNASKVLNEALDERVAKFFISKAEKGGFQLAPFGAAQPIRLQLLGQSPLELSEEILRKGTSEDLLQSPLRRGAELGVRGFVPQQVIEQTRQQFTPTQNRGL